MKVGMIQSNYIPWRGYFDFIDDVDVFVFYDDVKYTHKSWRNRNLIKTAEGPLWLSVPVRHDSTTRIDEAEVLYESRWVEKHLRSMEIAYCRAPYYRQFAPDISELLRHHYASLSELNIALCIWICRQLGIKTSFRLSSEFGISGDKYSRPLEILRAMGATTYLSGPTARPYTNEQSFIEAGISLEYKSYDYLEYPQLHGAFDGQVSILDLMFNCGSDVRQYLKSTRPINHRGIQNGK